jgi:hypothetical protein
MNVFVTAFDVALFTIAFVVLGLEVPYWGYRFVKGIRVYYKFRGTRLVTCPETHEPALVEVDAKSMGMQVILSEPSFRLSECSRWPMRRGCGQDCLRQIESRPSELRISTAWRTL